MAKGTKTGGRTAGTPNRISAATRERIGEGDPFGFLLDVMQGKPVERAAAKEGDAPETVYPTLDQSISAAATLSHKLCPNAREPHVAFELPAMEGPQDSVIAASAVLQAVARGELTPSEGNTVANVIDAHRRALETHELEKRIVALEGKSRA